MLSKVFFSNFENTHDIVYEYHIHHIVKNSVTIDPCSCGNNQTLSLPQWHSSTILMAESQSIKYFRMLIFIRIPMHNNMHNIADPP